MFLGILNWMIANSPAFIRPATRWLTDGLRKLTGHISGLWNALGHVVGGLYGTVAYWRGRLVLFVITVTAMAVWLKTVYIPARINALLSTVVGLINSGIATAYNTLMGALRALEQWALDRMAELGGFAASILLWAQSQLASVDAYLNLLVNGLRHVMSGPAVLAEWLVGELWHAALRRLYTERDRIFEWLFSRSTSAALWLARLVEDMIVRML